MARNFITGRDVDKEAFVSGLRTLADGIESGAIATTDIETRQSAPGGSHAEGELHVEYVVGEEKREALYPLKFAPDPVEVPEWAEDGGTVESED